MMNKKLLAAAVATVFTTNAFAAVDLDAAGTTADPYGTAVFASEAITASDLTGVLLEAVNNANILDFDASLGFTIGNGTSKYIRVTLGNGAEFDATPTLVTANATASVAQGGDGFGYVIFEVAATAALPTSQTYTVAAANYLLASTGSTSVSVDTYETAGDAVAETSKLYSDTAPLATVSSVVTGEIATEGFSTALVAKDFKEFSTAAGEGDAVSAILGTIGELTVAASYVDGTAYNPAGVAVTAGSLLTASQTVTISGNFTYGTFNLATAADCTTGSVAMTVNADEDAATSAAAITTATPYWFCVSSANTEVKVKSSYTIELDTDEVSDVIGKVVYDTTSIEMPYLTTFSDYNQRLYLVNYGSSSATYTISFVSEDGVTATAKAGATGEVPAGEMVSIKATDIVTLTGKTRTSAIIEIEAEDEDVAATTQSVNLSNGTTDTVVLN